MEGWIKLHRSLTEHPFWLKEKFTWGQAWVDLLMLANHQPGTIWVRGQQVKLKRGQVGWSEVRLAERWRWTRNKVKRFKTVLEMEHMIEQQTEQQNLFLTSVISIVNYERFQETIQQNGQQTEQQTIQQAGSRRYTNKNVKNEKKTSSPYSPPSQAYSFGKDLPFDQSPFWENRKLWYQALKTWTQHKADFYYEVAAGTLARSNGKSSKYSRWDLAMKNWDRMHPDQYQPPPPETKGRSLI